MPTRTLTRLALGLGLTFGALATSHAALPTYRIVDLGLSGYGYSHAWAMNEQGEILGEVGRFGPQDRSRPFIWSEATGMRFWDSMVKYHWDQLRDLNNQGQVVGEVWEGFVWNEAYGVRKIEGLGRGTSYPFGINDHGVVAGYSYPHHTAHKQHVITWTGRGGLVDLHPDEAYESAGYQINNHNQVVGYMEAHGKGHVATVFKQGEAPKVLGCLRPTPLGRCNQSDAKLINDAGQVAGTDTHRHHYYTRAFFWSEATGMIDMADGRYGDQNVEPLAMNSLGQAVGERYNFDVPQTPFYWTLESGMVKIKDLLDPNDPLNTNKLKIYQPVGIDTQGRIAINAKIGGVGHALMLVPIQ